MTRSYHHRQALLRFFLVDRKSRLHHQIKWFSDSKNGIVLIFDPIALVEELKSSDLMLSNSCPTYITVAVCCVRTQFSKIPKLRHPPKSMSLVLVSSTQHQQTSKRLEISTSMYDKVCIKL